MLISNMYEKKLEKSCPIKSCFDGVQLEPVVVMEVNADDGEGHLGAQEGPAEGAATKGSCCFSSPQQVEVKGIILNQQGNACLTAGR